MKQCKRLLHWLRSPCWRLQFDIYNRLLSRRIYSQLFLVWWNWIRTCRCNWELDCATKGLGGESIMISGSLLIHCLFQMAISNFRRSTHFPMQLGCAQGICVNRNTNKSIANRFPGPVAFFRSVCLPSMPFHRLTIIKQTSDGNLINSATWAHMPGQHLSSFDSSVLRIFCVKLIFRFKYLLLSSLSRICHHKFDKIACNWGKWNACIAPHSYSGSKSTRYLWEKKRALSRAANYLRPLSALRIFIEIYQYLNGRQRSSTNKLNWTWVAEINTPPIYHPIYST